MVWLGTSILRQVHDLPVFALYGNLYAYSPVPTCQAERPGFFSIFIRDSTQSFWPPLVQSAQLPQRTVLPAGHLF